MISALQQMNAKAQSTPISRTREGPMYGAGLSQSGVMGYPLNEKAMTRPQIEKDIYSPDFKHNIGGLLDRPVTLSGIGQEFPNDPALVPLGSPGHVARQIDPHGMTDTIAMQLYDPDIPYHDHNGKMEMHPSTIDHEAVHIAQDRSYDKAGIGKGVDGDYISAFLEPHAAFYDNAAAYHRMDKSGMHPNALKQADLLFGVGTDDPTYDPALKRFENARDYGSLLGQSVDPNYRAFIEQWAPNSPELIRSGMPEGNTRGLVLPSAMSPEGLEADTR